MPLTDTLSPGAVLVMVLLLALLMARVLWDRSHPDASCAHKPANGAYRSMHLYPVAKEVLRSPIAMNQPSRLILKVLTPERGVGAFAEIGAFEPVRQVALVGARLQHDRAARQRIDA